MGLKQGVMLMKLYNLTSAQSNIYELQKFYKGTSISNLCGAIIFKEKMDRVILMQAVRILIQKHEGLRLRFVEKNGKAVQYISEECCEEIGYKEFSSDAEMKEYCNEQAHIPFEINDSVMFRITVFDFTEKSGIMLCASHLISDAWTYSILAGDVYEIYNNLCMGKEIDGEVYSFTECIEKNSEYLLSKKYTDDCRYWLNKYNCDVTETPIRICKKINSSALSKRYTTVISAELSHKVKTFCNEERISLSAFFESSILLYSSKINRNNEFVTIGMPVLGRSGAKERNTVGMFISVIPLTEKIDQNESVISLCKKTDYIHREIFRHRNVSYRDIITGIRRNSNFSGRLYDIMVSCQNAKTDVPAKTEWFSNGYSEIPMAFHIDNRDSLDRYTITIDYQTDIFAQPDEIILFEKRIEHIIEQIISNKETTVKNISILPEEEYDMLIHVFNGTAAEYPKEKCVHDAFSEYAANHPDKPAVVFRKMEYTYKQINKMSDSLAHFLKDNGIGRNDVVPIISRRSPYIIIAMLAILKAGGAYMPVSPDFPKQRIKYMIGNVQAPLVLTYGYDCDFVKEIRLESFDYSYSSETPLNHGSSDDMCYIIFTSGSTGKPKGTVITHRNVMNYCSANRFNVVGKIISKDVNSIVSVTDIVFDIFVTESLLPLINGMVIYLADDEQSRSQKQLSKLITECGAQVLQTTPTKMRSFLFNENDCKYLSVLHTIILGGEEFSAELCKKLKKYTHAEIYNIYGPAETTVWSTLTPADENDITIGKPVANTRIYILDEEMNPVPIGTSGEIYISGDGVGKGYFNNLGLTTERFLPNPFLGEGVMYKTGDMGFIRCDGNIEFLGRDDFQIKLRGLRIELGEIENVMNDFVGIEHSAVLCRSDDKGEKYLVGYYSSEGKIDEIMLREYMSEKIPAYMIPNTLIFLPRMPMTQSGKINRNELPAPDVSEIHKLREYTAPENETEKFLCDIMAKVLGVPQVGTEDDFFELGGDSLSAIQFVALAEDKGFYFTPQNIYECSTVKKLSLKYSTRETGKIIHTNYRRYPLERTAADLKLFDIFAGLTRHIYWFEVSGVKAIDFGEKYIFCPNHESNLDCMWVWASLCGYVNLNNTCALIAAEHLDKDISRRIFRISGGIPIERRGDFTPSLKRAITALKNDKQFLLIHPEGTRTRNGRLSEFKKGAALIAEKTGVKVIPVFIEGAREIYPINKGIPHFFNIIKMEKYPLKICFGTPIEPKQKSLEQITYEIKRQIAEMRRNENNGNCNRC